jgi:hypothetical protein
MGGDFARWLEQDERWTRPVPHTWGLYVAAGVLLAVAGLPKIVAPASTLKAAREMRLPFVTATTVRAFGAAEVVLAVLAVVVGGRVLALLLGATYVGFAALVARAVGSEDVTSCGCFAGDDSPPSVFHVAIDLGLAVAAFLVVSGGAPSVASMVSHRGAGAVTFAVAAGIVDAGLVYLAMVKFPRRSDPLAAWRQSDRRDRRVKSPA